MNTPNRLTLARILMAPLYLMLLLWDFPFHHLIACVVFVVAAITDLLDGRIARRRGIVTDLGKFLDPIADKMLTTAAFVGFLALDRMNPWALMLILTREFAVTSVRLMAAGSGTVIAANTFGKIKTVFQYIAIIYTMVALEFVSWRTGLLADCLLPEVLFSAPMMFSELLIWVSTVLTVASGVQYIWRNRGFLSAEK